MRHTSNPSANARLRKGERTIIFKGKKEFFFHFEVISFIGGYSNKTVFVRNHHSKILYACFSFLLTISAFKVHL